MSDSYAKLCCCPPVTVGWQDVRAVAVAVAMLAGALLWAGCSPKSTPEATGVAGAHAHGGAADPCLTAAAPATAAYTGAADPCLAATAPATVAAAQGGEAKPAAAGEGEPAASGNLSPEAIEAMNCECGIRIVDCNECRYESGVVKLRKETAAALVKTAKVEAGPLVRRLRLTGEVAFDATAMVDVLPMAPGTVRAVKVRLGQEVRAGDVLAVIHSSEIGEAKATYLEAVTAAEIAVQERDRQRQISAALTRLLTALPKGAANLKLNTEPLGEWKSKLVGAAARLDQARIVCDRETALVAKDASSKAELETAQRELHTAEADCAALAEEAQLSLKMDLLRAENAARQTEVRRVAAEQRLHFFGLEVEAIRRIKDMQENGSFADLTITAPRAGTITALTLTAGRFVDTAQSLCTIADLSSLWVWCDLYERDLAALHEFMRGQGKPAATVKVAAFTDTFRGEVDLLGSEVSEATRTLKVRVQVPAHDGKLRPGMFATVEIELPSGRTVTLVPRDAVLTDEGREFVFLHWRDDLWLQRQVVLGDAEGETVEVVSGLEPGAEVVVAGGFMLKSDILREKMGAGCAD
jgi:multidrug efflux pump subunit AcrA (membrane-fusion protein)